MADIVNSSGFTVTIECRKNFKDYRGVGHNNQIAIRPGETRHIRPQSIKENRGKCVCSAYGETSPADERGWFSKFVVNGSDMGYNNRSGVRFKEKTTLATVKIRPNETWYFIGDKFTKNSRGLRFTNRSKLRGQ